MNIFKVLASGKKSFSEESASAVLAWLLSPTMDHGLGYNFLLKFVDNLLQNIKSHEPSFADIKKNLSLTLRENESTDKSKFWIDLEYCVGNAHIDIVMQIGDWIIAIENKIYARSTQKGQLKREVDGLKRNFKGNKKICFIYLVPTAEKNESEQKSENRVNGDIEKQFNEEIETEAPFFFKILATWQHNSMEDVISIAGIIKEILSDNSQGKIDPVSSETICILKSLYSFISGHFSGYDYRRDRISSGQMNPLTESRKDFSEIRQQENGYVGVSYGIRGLIRMGLENKNNLKKYKFQFTTQDMSEERNWLEKDIFIQITEWLLGGSTPEIRWDGYFPTPSAIKIAKDFKDKVFIGIQGGEDCFIKMDQETIKNREWLLNTSKTSEQWIDGNKFIAILEDKKYPVNDI